MTPVSPHDALPPRDAGALARWESDVVLADGGTVHLRPLRSTDESALRAAWTRLSPESIYFRFHGARRDLSDDEWHHLANVDYEQRMALVGELGDEIVAVARYDRDQDDPTTAEAAFTVVDREQGRGLGTVLFEHLAAVAREQGVERFLAYVLADNYAMLRLFEQAGLALSTHRDGTAVEVEIPLDLTDQALAAIEEREVRAGARSVHRLLAPASIAVVGVGRERGGIGHEIFRNLLAGEFNGPVWPVNPAAASIASVSAFGSVLDIPHDVDLAVLAVPAASVRSVAEECARKGARSLVVITSGFAESGADGASEERALVSFVRRNGMRMVGPNCLGVLNTASDVRMNATFSPNVALPGRVGFVSQSGALGIAVLGYASKLGLGVSSFVSIGNRADLSANDLLEYWETDDRTEVALLYLESFGNPRHFGRLARRVARTKPVVAVKAGRTLAGSRAAASHTAAMANPDETVDALFRQAGVIRVDTLGELFDVARVVASQPLPGGRRVGVVGNGGGPAILTADACERSGLTVPELARETRAELATVLSERAAVSNPIDLGADATAEHYELALGILLDSPDVDVVVVGFTPPLVTRTEDVAAAIVRAAERSPGKPVLANLLQADQADGMLHGATTEIPTFAFPDSAVRALAHAADYAAWRERPVGELPTFPDIDIAAARNVVARALDARPDGGWLTADETLAMCAAFGIPVPATRTVESAEEALAAAREIDGPYALKASGAQLAHKTDVGGVRLGLISPEEVAGAYVDMRARIGPPMSGAVVQPMVDEGVETIIGVVQDPDFGPLVMFGLGGTAAEVFGDRAFRIVPVTDRDADDLIATVRGARLLTGYRGAPPADVAALRDLILRVGVLADALPEVSEMDLNPVIATPHGVVAVDVKISLSPTPPKASPGVRRLG